MTGLGPRLEKLERPNRGNQRPFDGAAFLERCLESEDEAELTPADTGWADRVLASLDAAEAE